MTAASAKESKAWLKNRHLEFKVYSSFGIVVALQIHAKETDPDVRKSDRSKV
jgi:hypothetical protein